MPRLRFQQKKRSAISTVIGTLFFLALILLFATFVSIVFNSYNNYVTQLQQYNQMSLEKSHVSVNLTDASFSRSKTISVTFANNSPFAIHLITLYVYDTNSSSLVAHFDSNSSASGVSGKFDVWIGAGQTTTVAMSMSWIRLQRYLFVADTDQGVLTSASFEST